LILSYPQHWHGINQRIAPFSDGSPQASQWPIPPLQYFDYEVHPDESGTFFYHSHVDFQAGTSAGPLIVQDEGSPPFHYDEERIVFLSDYFNRTDQNITAGLLANPFKWSGETNSLLVNGQSGMASNMTALCAPAIFNVEPDKTYRLWFIGSTALSFISLAFEDYTDLSIIEADGTYTKPFLTPYLQVGTGQRFSVLFKTKSVAELKAAGKTDFWIQLENRERPHQWLVPTQYSHTLLQEHHPHPPHHHRPSLSHKKRTTF
jgi:L-ascorbate oxidase